MNKLISLYANAPRKLDFPYRAHWCAYSDFDVHPMIFFPPSTDCQFTLRLAARGSTAVQEKIDGVLHSAEIPHLAVKLPGKRYEYALEFPREAISIGYTPETMAHLAAAGLRFAAPYHPLRLTESLLRRVEEFKHLILRREVAGVPDLLDVCCYGLLNEVFFQPPEPSNDDPERERIQRIADRLRNDCPNSPDWDGIGAANGFSRRSFYRHWSRVMDLSPREYVNRLRLREAARLLRETDLPVKTVADRMRFAGENYFCTCFTRFFGISPRRYRRRCVESIAVRNLS